MSPKKPSCIGVHPGLAVARHFATRIKVIMNTPTYGFWTDLKWSRTVANENKLLKDKDGVYHIDWDDFEARLTPDTHAFVIQPSNLWQCWSGDDLLRMGELCLKHGVTVLADEIHCDFVNIGQTYTPLIFPTKGLWITQSPSKRSAKPSALRDEKRLLLFN